MGFFIYLALTFLVGKLARDRGRSFGSWTFMSILFSPLLMIIILFSKSKLAETVKVIENTESLRERDFQERQRRYKEKKEKEKEKVEKERIEKEEKDLTKPINERERYRYLSYKKEAGTLTQEEFIELEEMIKVG